MAILGRDVDVERSEGFKRSRRRVSECVTPGGKYFGCESDILALVGGRNDSKGRIVTSKLNWNV